MDSLVKKLDLSDYLKRFVSFFAREKEPVMEGDVHQHYRYIQALSKVELISIPEIPNMDDALARLRKQAVLGIDEIFYFVKMVEFFNRLKAIELPEPAKSWIRDIEIPSDIMDIPPYFTQEGEINPEREPELRDIAEALRRNKEAIRESLQAMAHSSKLSEYLVDNQIHWLNGEETLLVRGGFSSAIKATVVGRSAGGFFYILPDRISKLKDRESELLSRKEAIVWRYCRDFSAILHKWERFLRFLDTQYDRFDHYQARVEFAKSYDYSFILPNKSKDVILEEFAHPAIDNPVPISISLKKPIMLITGVNAGGKTMLLKSILSAVLMSKYLLPFRCNSSKTSVGTYSNIYAIIDDPQSVKNDISTFAGRMLEFSKLFSMKNSIVGVDEIELGTDADEAASLFRVLLDTLKARDITFVITTHHKRLASLMAGEDDVELVAALYDENKRMPTYTYLQGSIGKSYAFETAQRYGIPPRIVERAKELYGEDKEKLNELIESSTKLEAQMRRKISELEKETEILKRKEENLKELEEKMQEEQRRVLATLENRYNAATKRALLALKEAENANARKLLNEAHKHKSKAKLKETKKSNFEPKVGDEVLYRNKRAKVLSMRDKEVFIDLDGIRMRVPKRELKEASAIPKTKSRKISARSDIRVEKSSRAPMVIKLLGKRADEAEDELDAFISNALLHGLSEVEIIHGTGSGVLAKVVSEYLKRHPKVSSFSRVKGNMGATLAYLD